jgi:transcriptional regulator GlxA family with amidase domain
MASERPQRRVVVLAFEGAQALDVIGPIEVFTGADRLSEAAGYDVQLVAPTRTVTTSSRIRLSADARIGETEGPIDTLVVAGGVGTIDAERNTRLIEWLRDAAQRSRRVASVCTGAFLLARAGLLDGKRATTHWASCETLQRRYPDTAVDSEPIFVRDGDVWTSAGVTAGMDLALALVEEDLGAGVALDTARWLVLFAKRPGGQSQFSRSLALQRAEHEPLREVQDWIFENVERALTVEALAGQAGMSVRTFARAFAREVGMTPASYVEAVRVERARLALESTGAGIEDIARSCGFGTPETMRRAFARRLQVNPTEYRRRFGAAQPHQEVAAR